MAFGGSAGGGVRSDINVTPLVDIVLVMLIIFIVAMPIVMKDISVDIPKKTDETVPPEAVPDQLVVEMRQGGVLFLNGHEINRIDLAAKIRQRLERKRDKVVFVDFDEATRYGDAVAVMDTVKGAGATTVALKIKDEAPAGAPAAPQ